MPRAAHLLLLAAGLLLARQLARGTLAFWAERKNFVVRRWPVGQPDDARQLGLQTVAFVGRDGATIRGWYIESRNGAALIVCQGSSSDRRAMLDDARALSAAGFGVLLFDWPGTGESDGRVLYGAPERAALQGAIDFVSGRTDVDSTRIGALGFSMGGYTVVQVAALDSRLASVVLAGTFDDPVVQTRREYASRGTFAVWGSLLALRVMGMPTAEMRPVDVIAHIAPRPLVVIAGSDDQTVPVDLSRRLFDAAGEPKELWLIQGATHGGYAASDSTYHRRIADFFTRTLPSHSPETAGPHRHNPKAAPITSRLAEGS